MRDVPVRCVKLPAHPHRGFETVTYMMAGHMRHGDDKGNTGDPVYQDIAAENIRL